MDSTFRRRSLSQAASGQTGGGRRQSQSTDQYGNMQTDGLVLVDDHSAFPGTSPASSALQNFPHSTTGRYTDLDPNISSSQLLDKAPPAAGLNFASPALQTFPFTSSRRYSPLSDPLSLPSSAHAGPPNKLAVQSHFSAQNPFQSPAGQQPPQSQDTSQQQQSQPPQLPNQPQLPPSQPKRERAPSQSWASHSSLPSTPTALRSIDTISLRSLHTHAIIGPDSWARPRSQPLILSLYLTYDTTSAARTDNIAQTFSYGLMAKDVLATTEGKEFISIDHLTSDLASLADDWPGETLRIVAKAPKALLRTTDGLERQLHLQRREHKTGEWKQLVWHVLRHEWIIDGLNCACIIGVNEHERVERQSVIIKICAAGECEKDDYGAQIREGSEMWRRLVRGICEVVEPSSFQTLEALSAHVARYCLENFPFPIVTIGVEKPSALTFVDRAGVEITRDRKWLSVR